MSSAPIKVLFGMKEKKRDRKIEERKRERERERETKTFISSDFFLSLWQACQSLARASTLRVVALLPLSLSHSSISLSLTLLSICLSLFLSFK
jgi:hypothetical protein